MYPSFQNKRYVIKVIIIYVLEHKITCLLAPKLSAKLDIFSLLSSPKYLTLYSLAILIVVRIGSEQLCSFSRGIFQPICKHFVWVQLFLKL